MRGKAAVVRHVHCLQASSQCKVKIVRVLTTTQCSRNSKFRWPVLKRNRRASQWTGFVPCGRAAHRFLMFLAKIVIFLIFCVFTDHQKLEREARICRLLKHPNIGKASFGV